MKVQQRSIATCIVLSIVTCGLYLYYWLVALLLLGGVIGSLFIMQDAVRTESIKNYTEGKYRLEEVVYSDTTYVVKRRK